METLDVLSDKESRTVIRSTLMKDWNMDAPGGFAELFRRADPDFIELKAYMHVGHSQSRLDRDVMPEHREVVEYARGVQECLDGFGVLKQVPRSNVALLAREEDTWIEDLKEGSEFWGKDEKLLS